MRKKAIIFLLFIRQKRKHDKMAFLMSRNRHVLLALGVDRIARNVVKAKFTRVVSQATSFTVSCETSIRSCSFAA